MAANIIRVVAIVLAGCLLAACGARSGTAGQAGRDQHAPTRTAGSIPLNAPLRASATPGSEPGLASAQPTSTKLSPTMTPSRDVAEQASSIQKRLTPSPLADAGLCSPLDGHSLAELPEIVSAGYDPPPPGKEQRHHGLDFSYYRRGERLSIRGVGVQAILPGRVAMALADSFPYGNVLIVETPYESLPEDILEITGLGAGQSLYSLYAHFDQPPLVTSGQEVEACQALGYVGDSGNAGVPHMHLETRLGPAGVTFAGMAYYSTQTTPEERANYERWRTSGDFRHFDPMLIFQTGGTLPSPTHEALSSD